MNAFPGTVFTFQGRRDGIKKTCNWNGQKKRKRKKEKDIQSERSLTFERALVYIPFSLFLLCSPPVKNIHVFFYTLLLYCAFVSLVFVVVEKFVFFLASR